MRCADCEPCRVEDIDPTTTVWRCDTHRQAYDAGLGALFADAVARGLIVDVPRPGPFTFPTVEHLPAPSGAERTTP